MTLYTAASHADVIKGAIPINAAVQIGNPDMAGLAFGRGLPDTVPGIGSDIKDPNSKELAYAEVPVVAFRQVYALAAVTHDLLPRIKCPTLVITSREDHVVDPGNGPRIVCRRGLEPRRAGLAGELVPCGHHRPRQGADRAADHQLHQVDRRALTSPDHGG